MHKKWTNLKKPLMVLAPLADVTDAAFRRLIARCGKPDVMWTEFVSADGLYHTREVQKVPDADNPLMKDLLYTEAERPIIAQLFTSKPEMMEYAAKLAAELGFDGVDINMGCPDRSIEKQGAGAGLIKTPALAVELIEAARRGVAAAAIPVSVKTRIGYNRHDDFESWIGTLIKAAPDALTIHARTRKEMSKVPADWSCITRAVRMRDEAGVDTVILGNGDVGTLEGGWQRAAETGADGVMIGRGIFGNPWRFERSGEGADISLEEKLQVLVEHSKLFDELLPHKNFAIMKKHFKAYVTGFDGAAEMRARLMEGSNAEEVERTVSELLSREPSTI